jgi:filamentous hemagglutinin family protein
MLGVGLAAVTSAMTGDGSMGTTVTQTQNAYTISGGTITGSNLFHSFGRFSVGTGDQATFTGPPAVANIVSRVTGGEQSVIDGLLRSDIAGANLYLLNPSGVLFGPNASLDVSGSFHVSTADFLRFADGAKFSAHLGQESVLTVASPAAFGFLGNAPAPITIQGSRLRVPRGEALSVIGGDVQIVGGRLRAPRGRLQLASVASPGEVIFSPLDLAPDLQVDSFARLGRVELSQDARLSASGKGGGTVLLRSGRLLVDRSFILADTWGDANGASLGLDLWVVEDAVIAHDSLLRSSPLSRATGSGGSVMVNAGRLTLTDGSEISSATFGAGRGGRLTVTATESISIAGRDGAGNRSALLSNALGEGSDAGAAGDLVVSAPLLLVDGGRIVARTVGDGDAGNIEVRVGRLELTGGGQIFNGTGTVEFVNGVPTFQGTGGPGRGGRLTVVATEAIRIVGQDSEGFQSALASNAQFGTGEAGDLFISTPSLTIQGGLVLASTESASSGNAGDLTLEVGTLTLTAGGQISSSTSGSGHGGNIAIQAQQIDLSDGGTISTLSSGKGNAGGVMIQAGQIFRSRNGAVTTEAEQADGGNIQLIAGSLVVLHDSQITATVKSGVGKGGNITIDVPSMVLEDSQIRADAFGGPGGNVLIVADVFLDDATSQVSASSALGIQGTVDIQAPVTSLSGALAPLPQAFVGAVALLPARCATRLSGGKYSSLVLGGRDGLPLDPGGLLPSPLGLGERLMADPALTRELRRQNSASRFALLEVDQKLFPQMRGGNRQEGAPLAFELGCSKWAGEHEHADN